MDPPVKPYEHHKTYIVSMGLRGPQSSPLPQLLPNRQTVAVVAAKKKDKKKSAGKN